MSLNGFKKRFFLWIINKLRPFKYSKFKSKLFNKIPGCHIGKNSIIVGPIFITGCSVIIGDNVHIGHDFRCEGNGYVKIENNCDIAPNVIFLTGSHNIGDFNRRAGTGKTLSIQVFSGCWIGANSVILGKEDILHIGPSSIVACMSNVIKNVDSNVIVAGNPSKVIKHIKI